MLDVIIVGAGAAGVGVGAILDHLGVEDMLVLEREKIGTSFKKWPKEMQLITPSFTTNFYGQVDLNSVMARTSPAYSLRKEHPTGREYAQYLKSIAEFCNLPVVEHTNVEKVTYSKGAFNLEINNGKEIRSRFLIWAAGEFQYPNTNIFPGAELCLHNSKVETWKQMKGDEYFIIGGYESGIDAAVNLSRLGKYVCVLDPNAPWEDKTTDPSLSLSPFTMERLERESNDGRINLIGGSKIKEVTKKDDEYFIQLQGKSKAYTSKTKPILATGFKSSLMLIDDLFNWEKEESYALLNEQDESTKTPGLFLVGPQVRHDNLIFCFIYKYRQRFGVVANAIGERLGLDTSILENYRQEGFYLDDLSCCGEECDC